MAAPRLSPMELRIMEVLWSRGPSCVRDIVDTYPARKRPAYTTVQTVVYRLEAKKALRRAHKVGNVHVFEAIIARNAAHRRLIDEFLSLFGGRIRPASRADGLQLFVRKVPIHERFRRKYADLGL